jgi:hypothetical protein
MLQDIVCFRATLFNGVSSVVMEALSGISSARTDALDDVSSAIEVLDGVSSAMEVLEGATSAANECLGWRIKCTSESLN